ncbi:GNAT family N-acetyltransferase [Microbulbifer sp. VTAC004]|uniref:GNAT family N-acetyltransferase n=1 Tax=Microbulbifer sp. VTAC004 TaxID=3243386 RepID=UPI0040391BF2
MDIEVLENPAQELIDFLDKKLDEFNWRNWEVKERLPLAVQIRNASGEVIAGAAARSFGDWLLLDTLSVSEELRGQNIGSQLLSKIEISGKQRGCKKCLLDTLNFQAMPFYKNQGYEVKWVQEGYPKEGCKYFMVKEL